VSDLSLFVHGATVASESLPAELEPFVAAREQLRRCAGILISLDKSDCPDRPPSPRAQKQWL
jgi:hypothetical protein